MPVGQIDTILRGEWDIEGSANGIDSTIKKYYLSAMPKVLEDSELQIHVDKLAKLVGKMINLVGIISIKNKKKEAGNPKDLDEIFTLIEEFEEPYIKAIRRLDSLREKTFSSK